MTKQDDARREQMTRRTFRLSDADWKAGHRRAGEAGETLTDVLRRLLSSYLVDGPPVDGYTFEYRAIPTTASLSPSQRDDLTVEGIRGPYADVRHLYPPNAWRLEERTVSSYRPAARKSV